MKLLLMLVVLLCTGISPDELNYKYYISEGPSMSPAIHAKDRLKVDPMYYNENSIERGDIIVFNVTDNKSFVKRVIGLPDETVEIVDNNIFIDGKMIDEPYIQGEVEKATAEGKTYNMDFPETKVPSDAVFVLGDNRRNSADSRSLGAVSKEDILGKVIQIIHMKSDTE